jgi:hypothetical protein
MPYFAIAPDENPANLINVEMWTGLPPHALPDRAVPLTGKIRRRALSGMARHDGQIDGALTFDLLERRRFNALMVAVFGGFTTPSRRAAFTLIDEAGCYSPFSGVIDKPTFEIAPGGLLRAITFPLAALTLLSVTKASADTLTAADRLVYGDTSGGSFALTLPAASAIQPRTVISVGKVGSAGTLTVARAGADTLNGGTSIALTVNAARVDLVSDGAGAWTSI